MTTFSSTRSTQAESMDQRSVAVPWPPHGRHANTGQRMALVRATNLSSASTVIDLVRGNEVVLLNCSALDQALAQRIIDMVSGGVCAMDGQVRRISPDVVMAYSALTSVVEARP